ncbi:TetR/AcrR family transcriptional regulator [Rugosimonospora acidiphila]|uniref:TetR/AcrR family transcriptional regulator n=1 Tax=Rugosimonospora acidiphila TaxID=556531 RepID=A0ABP9RRL1_9ACTN
MTIGGEHPARGLRARVRTEMVEEIKATARRHLAAEGANLSLRAVARDLGMVSSAVYRYFPSRDALLTALVADAHDALGQAVERAEAAVPRRDLRGRWLASCHAVRAWALDHPAEYALIYGSPVPGYAAPVDMVGPAGRIPAVLASILRDAVAAGVVRTAGERLPKTLRADLRRMGADPRFADLPEPVLARGMTGWIQLLGAVSFEVFGRLEALIEDAGAFFDQQLRTMAAQLGL